MLKTKLALTCYFCGKKSTRTYKGNTRELNEKIKKLKKTYACRKCGSNSFRYRTVYK